MTRLDDVLAHFFPHLSGHPRPAAGDGRRADDAGHAGGDGTSSVPARPRTWYELVRENPDLHWHGFR